MWIPSSPCKNRVSDRGRIDIFSQRSISAVKASLLLLALASFSVVCAASDCDDPVDGICFATSKDDLKDGQSDYIGIKGDEIIWDTSKLQPDSKIDLYTRKCGKLSFIMSKPENLGDDCKFSMLYNGCDMDIEWEDKAGDVTVHFKYGKIRVPRAVPDSEVNVVLEGANLNCSSEKFLCGGPEFCPFSPSRVDDKWCKFDFAFNKKTGSCDGKIQFDEDYKLPATPAPTTVAPTTTPDATSSVSNATDPNNANAIDPINANTTPGADAAGLALWIIILIVVVVLVLVLGGIGFVVFWICRRKRRRSAERMAEKGNMGSDCQCESTIPPPKSPIKIPRKKKSGSEMVVDEPSTKDEDGDGSKLASNVEASKPVSQMQKNSKNMPVPSPSPLPEENKPKRILAPDELYEPLGDPMKAIPMHLSEKKVSEKKKGHGMNFANRKPYKRPQT